MEKVHACKGYRPKKGGPQKHGDFCTHNLSGEIAKQRRQPLKTDEEGKRVQQTLCKHQHTTI